MTRRNQRLEHLLSPVQQRRLRQLWQRFEAALSEAPPDQKLLNRLRAQMPPGGLSWPWWKFVLSAERAASDSDVRQVPAAVAGPAPSSQEAA